ncbi:hypothetical protein [Pseudaminobacter soli (ex Li et al. 2025)]|uniref:Pyridoxamine 5'-phosphate oxidase putative domain-containing protein n=1 Tax=Pseudaminobacter soli (ex Li et al. 2025) TaxID=1295366 RepID=A0A2P7SKW0_9HYPH|nr:hypothetical protein [Mesorhizobium soli]PSJ63130.1 hypothetical protein C7I85_06175 [Mesorhizobium soli]
MISADVAAFVESPVMILVSTRDSAHRAFIARGSGIRFDRRHGHLDVLLCRGQWSDVAGNAVRGAPIAVTVVRPSDYRAFQVKGVIQEVASPSEEEQQRATAYVARMLEIMAELGVTKVQLSHTLTDKDLVRISFQPTDLFAQTPGPDAGQRVGHPIQR